jgi:hypothetical protein
MTLEMVFEDNSFVYYVLQEQEDSVGLVMKGIQRIGVFDIFSMLSFLRRLHEFMQTKSKV